MDWRADAGLIEGLLILRGQPRLPGSPVPQLPGASGVTTTRTPIHQSDSNLDLKVVVDVRKENHVLFFPGLGIV